MSHKSKLVIIIVSLTVVIFGSSLFVMDRFGLSFARFTHKLIGTIFTEWAEVDCENYDQVVLPLEDSKDPGWLFFRLTGYDARSVVSKKNSSNLSLIKDLVNRTKTKEIYVFVSANFIYSAQDEHPELITLSEKGRVRLITDYPYGEGILASTLQQCRTEFCESIDDHVELYFGPTLDQTEILPSKISHKNILKHYGFWKLSFEKTYSTHNEIIELTTEQLNENKNYFFPDGECVTSGIMLGHFEHNEILGTNSRYVLDGIPDNCLVFSDALEMAGVNLQIDYGNSNLKTLFTNWSTLQRTIQKRKEEMKCSIKKVS